MSSNRGIAKPFFPVAPPEYNQAYFADLVNQFTLLINQSKNPGDGRFSSITIKDLPSDDLGLESGTLYRHGTTVRVSDLALSSVRGVSATSTIGTVTVSTP